MSKRPTSASPAGQSGFTLAGLLVIMTVIMVIVSFSVPRQWSMIVRRDRDRQTIFAMKQYARAIREYRRVNNGVFPTYNQLRDARKPRFVRGPEGELPDPLTGEKDWLAIPAASMNAARPDVQRFGFVGANNNTNNPPGTLPAIPARDNPTPIGGVRPNKTGESFLELKGAKSYEEWSYTVLDLEDDINAAMGKGRPGTAPGPTPGPGPGPGPR